MMDRTEKIPFRHFGTMVDMSRNAVMNVSGVKKWIDVTSDLGYNTLMLYTEDTYEIADSPYFGYMRGRYSKAELKEIDAYAREKDMELIPCTQMLAHQTAVRRWPEFSPHFDTADIMLVGDEWVYQLIENMFQTLAECFTSRLVNVGMDEAHMLGRGRYYDEHGAENRFEILLTHLQRVAEIGKKYGFRLQIWSDMFFRLAAGGEYYVHNAKIDASVAEKIPDNVELAYWDYYSQDEKHYDAMMTAHERLCPGTWFAGGLWTWTGFAPHNGYSMRATGAALKQCLKHGVQDVILTMWGDNGGECSRFALLPALFYASEFAKGHTNKAEIREKFRAKYGISFDRFMLLDLPGTPGGGDRAVRDPEKYLLYNDCLMGLLDSTLTGQENEQYQACARKLRLLINDGEWGWLFEPFWALCRVLGIKAELGAKTRKAYQEGDREALGKLIGDYKALLKALDVFYDAFRRQWYHENKAFGFEIQDIRLGGLSRRVRNSMERLQAYCDGRLDAIEELEERQLDFRGNGEEFQKEPLYWNQWSSTISPGIV